MIRTVNGVPTRVPITLTRCHYLGMDDVTIAGTHSANNAVRCGYWQRAAK